MMGDKLRRLREARSWSQAHLAEAARVNVRTVQRIEAGEPCSFETMLSLAAALNIDVSEFETGDREVGSSGGAGSRRTIAALLCVTPGALFVLMNVMQSAGLNAPYDVLASAGSVLMSFRTFNLISPVLFVGGAAVAVLLCVPSLLRLRIKSGEAAVAITGIELHRAPLAFSIALFGALTGGALLFYAALENLRTLLP
jgi:transcriptional regulator with XRE-family HTH domain